MSVIFSETAKQFVMLWGRMLARSRQIQFEWYFAQVVIKLSRHAKNHAVSDEFDILDFAAKH